ncbi:MAG: acetolactate synthase, partial [Synergistaceae bacterium]|nr:acetolactate synthase [Synergistaceae bacterium]
MIVDQISIFVENRLGTLAEVTEIMGGAGIDLRALSLADTADFGVLRVIVDDP